MSKNSLPKNQIKKEGEKAIMREEEGKKRGRRGEEERGKETEILRSRNLSSNRIKRFNSYCSCEILHVFSSVFF
jgi:hypothetical protein